MAINPAGNKTFKPAQAFANCSLVDSEGNPIVLASGKEARFPKGLPIYANTEIGANILAWVAANPSVELRISASVQLADKDPADIQVMACPFS